MMLFHLIGMVRFLLQENIFDKSLILMQEIYTKARSYWLWNWKDNLSAGKSLFAKKEVLAKAYPSKVRKRGGAYRYATNYTEQEFLTDAFQLYNGFHYWTWAPLDPKRSSLGGRWIKDPNLGKPKSEGGYGRDYGGTAMEIYKAVINGNPPAGW